MTGSALNIPNLLTLKLMGTCGLISVKLSTAHMADFQVAGLMLFDKASLFIGVNKVYAMYARRRLMRRM